MKRLRIATGSDNSILKLARGSNVEWRNKSDPYAALNFGPRGTQDSYTASLTFFPGAGEPEFEIDFEEGEILFIGDCPLIIDLGEMAHSPITDTLSAIVSQTCKLVARKGSGDPEGRVVLELKSTFLSPSKLTMFMSPSQADLVFSPKVRSAKV